MVNLQKKLNLRQAKVLKLVRELRSKKVQFEDHIWEDLEKLSHSLDEYYTVENLEFLAKKGTRGKLETVKRDLVFVKEPAKFIEHIISERGLNKEKLMVRIGLDGGQGTFKVVVSIFETDYDPEVKFKIMERPDIQLRGSKRILVMALA